MMKKASELAKEWEQAAFDTPEECAMDFIVQCSATAQELRRLAEIERKYNEILAQEPVAYVTNSGKITFCPKFDADDLPVKTKLYFLKNGD